MSAGGIPEQWARMVIEAEVSSVRFEDFCVELFSDVEGIDYVRTSRSYDLGRDARGVAAKSGAVPPFICCSLRGDHEDKALGDIRRILEFVQPKSILICCSTKISESAIHGIEQAARKVAPSLETIRTHGLDQLSQLAARYPKAVRLLYSGEVATIKAALGYDDEKDESIKLTGMRIALTTQLQDDATGRRKDLLWNLILTALSNGMEREVEELAMSISEALHLSRVINESYLQGELSNLAAEGFIDAHGDSFSLTPLGRLNLQERNEAGSKNLLIGQEAVRRQIASLTGHSIDSKEYSLVWNVFLDGLASVFLLNGVHIISSISAIAKGESSSINHQELHAQIRRIGERIATLDNAAGTRSGDALGDRIRDISQAIMDLFTEREGEAFHWIEGLCCTFIDICSLGLEPNAQEEVALRLKEFEFLLDTDVVLSLLAEGEPNHKAIRAMVKGWKELGGRLYIGEAVLEEAAYHAWISQKEYDATWRELPKMPATEIHHLLDNVFVRTFTKRAGGRTERRRWGYYIQGFRGDSKYDFKKILEILKEDYKVEFIDERSIDRDLSNLVAQKIISEKLTDARAAGHAASVLNDKSTRDGRLVALLSYHRQLVGKLDHVSSIISSSSALAYGCEVVRATLGAPDPIMSPAAIAWLLSLVPGAHISLSSLRGVLFDASLSQRLPPAELLTMRVLEKSEQYEMHWSRRGPLVRAVRNQVATLANQMGQSTQAVRAAMQEENEYAAGLLSEVIAKSIDEIASSKSEKRIGQLVRDIEKLRGENDKLRSRRGQV